MIVSATEQRPRIGSRAAVPGLLLVLALAGCAGLRPGGERDSFPPQLLGELGVLSSAVRLTAEDYYRQRPEEGSPALPFELLGFTELAYHHAATGEALLTAWAFEFNTPLEAYGLGLELSRGRPGASVSVRGRRLWQFDGSGHPAGGAAAAAFSSSLDKAFGAPSPLPPEARTLLEAGADPESLRYEPLSLLGSTILAPALAGEAGLADGSRVTLFVSSRSSAEEAEGVMRRYLGSVSGGRTGVAFRIGIGDVACALLLHGRVWLNLSRMGPRIAGVAGARTPSGGWALLTRLAAGLEG